MHMKFDGVGTIDPEDILRDTFNEQITRVRNGQDPHVDVLPIVIEVKNVEGDVKIQVAS